MTIGSLTVAPSESNAPIVSRAREVAGSAANLNLALRSSSLEVREVNELGELESYAADWNLLLPATSGASYFHSYDWFVTYWRHFGHDQRMRVMLVLDEGRLAGIVPLAVVRERTRLGNLRSLRYPLHGWGSFYGPIGGEPLAVLGKSLEHVLASRRDWDLLDMLWVDRDGADQGATAAALADARLSTRESPWLPSAQIEIDGGWEAYWAGRTSHFRTNIRRCERRLRESGEVTYVRHRPLGRIHGDCDPRWDLYDASERIAAGSWQGGSTTGTTLSHDAVRDYLRAAHEAAASFGGVDMNLLLLDGRPIAFAYNYHYRGYVYGLRTGFDANSAPAGAGAVLQRLMIEDSCRRGDHVIDLGPGSPDSKRKWQTRIAVAWRYTHYSLRSPRAQMLRIAHAIKALGSRKRGR